MQFLISWGMEYPVPPILRSTEWAQPGSDLALSQAKPRVWTGTSSTRTGSDTPKGLQCERRMREELFDVRLAR